MDLGSGLQNLVSAIKYYEAALVAAKDGDHIGASGYYCIACKRAQLAGTTANFNAAPRVWTTGWFLPTYSAVDNLSMTQF